MKKWAKIITLSSIVVLASASAQIAYADTNTSKNETAIPVVVPNTGATTIPSSDTTVPVVEPNTGATTIPSSDTTVPAVVPNTGATTIPSSDTTVPAVAPNTGTTTIPSSDTTVPAVSPNTGTATPPSSDTTVPAVSPNTGTTTTPSSDTTVPTSPSEQPSVVAPTDPGATVATGSSSQASSSSSSSATTPTSEDKNKKDNATSDNKVSVPTIDGGTTTLIPDVKVPTNNPGVSAQTAVEAGASQVGTTSQVTGQVVQEVTPSAPVQTETGASIVSTQNGNVVLSDGSVVAPEAVGGTVNEDKTISVTDKDGKLKTLPNTGLKESVLLTFAGFGLLAIVVSFFLKKRSN